MLFSKSTFSQRAFSYCSLRRMPVCSPISNSGTFSAGICWRSKASSSAVNHRILSYRLAEERQLIKYNPARLVRQPKENNGAVVQGKYGPKSNAAVDMARKASECFARLAKALKTAGEQKRHVGRPSLSEKTWNQLPQEQEKASPPEDEWSDFVPQVKPR